MFHTDNIEAIDILQKKLPDELQDWHRWGNISELHYYKEMYSEEYCDYICCIELILRDVQEKYAINYPFSMLAVQSVSIWMMAFSAD